MMEMMPRLITHTKTIAGLFQIIVLHQVLYPDSSLQKKFSMSQSRSLELSFQEDPRGVTQQQYQVQPSLCSTFTQLGCIDIIPPYLFTLYEPNI